MNRTIFLVDGFNLYHSLVDAQKETHGKVSKWLDLKNLCLSYLPVAGRIAGNRANLERIYYFSAPPTHRSQDKQDRHSLYMRCLRSTGINVELARFKPKDVFCPKCKSYFIAHEEKETDVAIAAKLFELCQSNEADTIILMTGDTDLAPAVRTCKRLYPDKLIFFAFPYKRTNIELVGIAPESFSIKRKSYLRYQFPDPLMLDDNTSVSKPEDW
ncbi:MAG: NYN domain-containing protein [Candidatus Ratteibacteria bacterium]|nr:NYN domain-containing protein [Candidatus Ratteibacteria bacterium]